MASFILKIRRAETPFYARLKALAIMLMTMRLPVPRIVLPLFGALYRFHFAIVRALRRMYVFFYAEPLFRGYCKHMGRNVSIPCLPVVRGHTRISIGDDVDFGGTLGIFSGRMFQEPALTIGNNASISHAVTFVVNREIVIEDGVFIAAHCYIADSDGHPRDPELRVKRVPPAPEDIRPVRICRNAWIGTRTIIQKGVTIGEGAIIGSNSVVITDIPPFAVAMGNPARVVVKDVRVSAGGQAAAVPTTSPR